MRKRWVNISYLCFYKYLSIFKFWYWRSHQEVKEKYIKIFRGNRYCTHNTKKMELVEIDLGLGIIDEKRDNLGVEV